MRIDARQSILSLVFLFLALLIGMAPLARAQISCPPVYRQYLPYISTTTSEHTVGNFLIIQPQSTTNLVTNPSVETATTGYTAVSSSIARSTTQQRRGTYSLAVTVDSGTTDGVYWGTFSTTSGQSYTFSVDVFAPLGMLMQIYFASTSGTLQGTATTFTGTGTWQRKEVTFTDGSSTTRRVYMTKNTDATTGVFYVDGLQIENLSYSTTYCDGEQPGCLWTGAKHASTSQRSSQYRGGGKKIDLQNYNAYLVSQAGTGMATLTNQTTAYSAADGSFLNRQSVRERSFTIALSTSGDGTAAWHSNRQSLINLIKPDLVSPQQPFTLIYDGGGKEMYLNCYYDGGLEMQDGIRDIETVAIKCLSVDPYWKTDGNDGITLNTQSTLSSADRIIQRSSSGTWSALGSGANTGAVFALTEGLDGTIYAGGSFTNMGGTSAQYLAKWSNSAWSAVKSTTSIGAQVNALATGPDGRIYIGGNFDNADGIANADRIVVYDPVANTYAALSTGANGNIWALAFGTDGILYVGGDFTTIGGTAANRIAKWNGSSFSAFGTGASAHVSAIAVSPSNVMYMAGDFVTANGVTVNGITYWNSTTFVDLDTEATFGPAALGGTLTGQGIDFGTDGALYAALTLSDGGPAASVAIATKWNGSVWSTLGTDTTSPSTATQALVYALPDGTVLFSHYSGVGPVGNVGVDIWNGSSMVNYLINPVANRFYAAVYTPATIYFGFDGADPEVAGTTTVTNNGSAKSYPVIKIVGPTPLETARIYGFTLYPINKTIYLDYVIRTGETLTFSLVPGAISFTSTFRGNVYNTVLPGSKTFDFALLPGDNTLALLSGDTTVVATATWQERCWSIDSSGT